MLDSSAYACVNDKFPRIAAELKLFWGQPEFVSHIEALIVDTKRGGTRKGFPFDVVNALTELLDLHNAEFPNLSSSSRGIWVSNNKIF